MMNLDLNLAIKLRTVGISDHGSQGRASGTRGARRAGGSARSLLTAPPSRPPTTRPLQVQGCVGARRGAVRGSPARAPVVSPHRSRYVSASFASPSRELERRSLSALTTSNSLTSTQHWITTTSITDYSVCVQK